MSWLAKFILSAGGHKIPEGRGAQQDPTVEKVGIHLLSNYGSGHEYVSTEPAVASAIELINRLAWEHEFFQVIVTLEPGLSMEVGGSLNEVDGLTGVYRNLVENEELVTSIPPESIKDMVEIVASFIRKDGQWREKFQFN